MDDKKWKFQEVMEQNGVDDIDDSVLHTDFVFKAKKFLELAKNEDADPEKLNELDNSLVEFFNENHEISDDEDVEKVQALKENAALKSKGIELQIKLDEMALELRNKEFEVEELKSKIPPEPAEPDKKIKPLDKDAVANSILGNSMKSGKSLTTEQLQELGIPAEKLSKSSFKHLGYLVSRSLFSRKWEVLVKD